MTITGANFTSNNTQVFFGTTEATNVQVISDSTIIVTVPPGFGVVDVTVVTPFGTSAVTPNDRYTYIPLAPTKFIGQLFKEDCCFALKSRWTASESPGIIFYRIYNMGVLVKTVLTNEPLFFFKQCVSKHVAKYYSVTAVDSSGTESAPTPIHLKRGSK